MKDLPLTDLKAAHDFVKNQLEELRNQANVNHGDYTKHPKHKELTELESALYDAILNKINEIDIK